MWFTQSQKGQTSAQSSQNLHQNPSYNTEEKVCTAQAWEKAKAMVGNLDFTTVGNLASNHTDFLVVHPNSQDSKSKKFIRTTLGSSHICAVSAPVTACPRTITKWTVSGNVLASLYSSLPCLQHTGQDACYKCSPALAKTPNFTHKSDWA